MAPPFGIRLEDADMQVQEIAADVAQLLRTTTFLNMSNLLLLPFLPDSEALKKKVPTASRAR